MTGTDIVLIVIAVVVIAALAFGANYMFGGRRRLHDRFGDEYDRLVAETGNRSAAEAELRERLRNHESLQLKDITDADRARFREGWIAVQKQFVDDPVTAVRNADELVSRYATERGYPDADFDGRVAQLSVEHAHALGHYRDAHDISVRNDAGKASTEDLRQALVHYRELFAALTGADLSNSSTNEPLRAVETEPATAAGTTTGQAEAERVGRERLATEPTDANGNETVDETRAASVGPGATAADRGVPTTRNTSED